MDFGVPFSSGRDRKQKLSIDGQGG
jgi:hypothetical protein